jgi:hypothetical protein
LGQFVADKLGYTVQESEGPPKSETEILERIERYRVMQDSTLFVRHPVVSNPIYDTMRPPNERVSFPTSVMSEFYSNAGLFIYCDPLERGLSGHVVKDNETKAHVTGVHQNRAHLLQLYREWAVRHAHIVYRIGDNMDRVFRFVAQEFRQ